MQRHLFDRRRLTFHSARVKIFPLPVILWLFVTSCGVAPPTPQAPPLVPGEVSAPSQLTPAEAMAIAQSLATHAWRPFSSNILHGKDKSGIGVNTPDVGHEPGLPRKGWWIPGEVNTGIPYKWGGFDDPAAFDAAIAKGLAGGDVSSPEKTPRR